MILHYSIYNIFKVLIYKYGNHEVVELLLKYNADINIKNFNDCNPLWIAAAKGHLNVVNVLLNNNAKINQYEKEYTTPLYICNLIISTFLVIST